MNAYSDIMIVKRLEGDFYVSEKIQGKDVYYKLLIERAKGQELYLTIEEARKAAQLLYQKIADKNPNCKIVEIDAAFYPKKLKAPLQHEYEFIIHDDDGFPLVGRRFSGKLDYFMRPDEVQYKWIDVKRYQEAVEKEIELLSNDSDEIDYYTLGMIKGYNSAVPAKIASIRFEIYKINKLLSSFDDSDLYAFDKLYYEGRKQALENAIEIQKKFKYEARGIIIHIINCRREDAPLFYRSAGIDHALGSYEIIKHDDVLFEIANSQADNCFVVFVDNKLKDDDKINQVVNNYPDRHYHFISRKRGEYTQTILDAIKDDFTLNQIPVSHRLKVAIISELKEKSKYFDTDANK